MHVPGSVVGNRYQIIQRLGRSKTGKTYLAKDLQATGDTRCVVEQLDPIYHHEVNWQIVRQYLLDEVAVLQRLGDHPQIPQLYNHFTEERQFYLVREYIDGDNLEQEVENKVFNEAETIFLLQEVLRILDFIHKTNVIHRDVQPVHLIRRKQDSSFVLINFCAIREIEATTINPQGELVFDGSYGNWAYVAPEQKTGRPHFNSDLYALARTAVYALTGRSPQELEQTNRNWQQYCQIDSKLGAILNKMMSPEVEQRYGSALEVLYDLKPLLKIGQKVGGRYLITQYLGGESGIETYLADNLRRQYQSPCSLVQIELPNRHGSGKANLDRRFAEELSVLERLGYHEQIPQLWDHFEENDEFYLVQEYIRGENLAQKIARQNLSVAETIQILIGALSVSIFIHQNRVIHRNIKPSSIIIREDGRVILTNFGILTDIKTLPHVTLEQSSNFDRLNYWSPEQIAGRPTVGSDLYALGMTIIEALTQAKPTSFVRESTGKLLWTQNLNLDRRLIRIIDKMVCLDLGQRYQSAEKVLSDLQKIDNFSYPNRSLPNIQTKSNRFNLQRLKPLPIVVGLLGVGCLLGSVEFAFPTVRPIYYWFRGKKLLPEKPQAALTAFNKAIDLKPRSGSTWSAKGDALVDLKQYTVALEAYTEAAELNPNNAANWQKQGDILYRLERFSEAIAAYDRSLEIQDSGDLYHRKGKALYQLEKYALALNMQEKALETDRLNPEFLSARAQNLLALRQYYEALTAFNRVQAIAPADLELWQDKFLVLQALNRPQEAERVIREINNEYISQVRLQPQSPHLWLAQGDFFAAAEMAPKAIDSYDRAITLEPEMYKAWLAKGQILTQLDREQDALTALDKALQIRPQSYLALQAKGTVYFNRDLSEAIAFYEKAIAINSNYAPLWRDLGAAFYQLNDYDRAATALTKATSLAPHGIEAWELLATVWQISGRDRQAILVLDKAIDLNPQDVSLQIQKASVYASNAQYNEACQTYRQSRAIAPDATEILDSMRRLGCRLN